MGRDEREGLRAVRTHRAHLRAVLPRFNGRLVGEIGDGTLSSFHSAIDAVNCARELQAALVENPDLRLRIGIHVGDVVFTDNTVLGDGVNVASRIHELAPPGGSCISERVYEEIRNKPEFPVKDLGEKKLKNVPRPIHVYALTALGAPEPRSSLGLAAVVGRSIAKHRRLAIGLGALILAAVAIAYFWTLRVPIAPLLSRTQSGAAAAKVTVAVLPFANLSADKQDEYFSDGMTDEMIASLSKIGGLQVAARSSSFMFKGHNEAAPKIARLLHVRNLLEGSVRKAANRVRISVQLIDEDGYNLWSQIYDENQSDVFRIQSEVAENVAEKLKVQLLPNEKVGVEKKPTENLDAYNLYLQGRYFYNRYTEDPFKQSIDRFQRAIALDPGFALAYAGLAHAYEANSDFYIAPRDAMPKAREAAEKALSIDSANAEAHTAVAFARFAYDWDWTGAEREFKHTLTLDPNSAIGHERYGAFLDAMGRHNEAIAQMERAHELSPLWPQSLVDLAIVWYHADRDDKALEFFQRAIAMDPTFYTIYGFLGFIRLEKGDPAGAVADVEKAVALNPSVADLSLCGLMYGLVGRSADAEKIVEQLKETSRHRYVSPLWIAIAYGGLDKDREIEWLEKAYEERCYYMTNLGLREWGYISSDPRFAALVKKVGIPK